MSYGNTEYSPITVDEFLTAAASGDLSIVRKFMSDENEIGDFNVMDAAGRTALYFAVKNRRTKVVNYLTNFDMKRYLARDEARPPLDINIHVDQQAPIHVAVNNNDIETI